jgi:hypothetical protein
MSLAATLWNRLNNKSADASEQVEIDSATLSGSSIVSVNSTNVQNAVFTTQAYNYPVHNPNATVCNCGSCSGSSLGKLLLGGITSTFTGTIPSGPPLTSEEAEELNRLAIDRATESKRLKVEEFKKLPADFRQTVINKLLWKKFVKEANEKEVQMTDREAELINKQNQANMGIGSYIGGSNLRISSGSTQWYTGPNGALSIEEAVSLPAGLTEADLIDAHNEACAEEALTG